MVCQKNAYLIKIEYDKYRFNSKEKPKYVKKKKTLNAQFAKRKQIIKT